MDRVQYVLEQGIEQFKEFRQLILVGTKAPVAYFAYPGKNSAFTSPECEIHTLANPGEDYVGALEALEEALSVRGTKARSGKSRTAADARRRNYFARTRCGGWGTLTRKRNRSRRVHDIRTWADGRDQGSSAA